MVSEGVKKIARYLNKQPYGYKQPELFINLTYKCPLRCKFCYVNYLKAPDFTYDDVEYLFTNVVLKSDYIKLVTFFGGEPLLKIDIIEQILEKYYDMCCQQDVHIAVITSLAVNGNKILKLQEKYPYFEIVASFDYHSGQRVDSVGNTCRVLDKYLPEELAKHRRNLCFHIVLDDDNSIKDLAMCQTLFKKYGLLYSWCWNKTPYKTLDITGYYNCMKRIIEENQYFPKQFCLEVDRYLNKSAKGCGIGSELFLSSDGCISPCSISNHNNQFMLMNRGVTVDECLEEIQHYEEAVFNNDDCKHCEIKGFCNGGCIIDRMKRQDFSKPNPYNCEIQRLVYGVYKELDKEYDLQSLQIILNKETVGNIDYCHNTSINIDMYDYFNIKE